MVFEPQYLHNVPAGRDIESRGDSGICIILCIRSQASIDQNS
jgi:hypothetical protein